MSQFSCVDNEAREFIPGTGMPFVDDLQSFVVFFAQMSDTGFDPFVRRL